MFCGSYMGGRGFRDGHCRVFALPPVGRRRGAVLRTRGIVPEVLGDCFPVWRLREVIFTCYWRGFSRLTRAQGFDTVVPANIRGLHVVVNVRPIRGVV